MKTLTLILAVCFLVSSCKKTSPAFPLRVLDDATTTPTSSGAVIYSTKNVITSTTSVLNEIVSDAGNNYIIGGFTYLGGVYSPGIINFTPTIPSSPYSYYTSNFYSANIMAYCPRTSSSQNFFGGNFKLSSTGSTNYWGYSYTGSSTTYAPSGSTLNGNVYVMKNYNGFVYFSGAFTTMNSVSCAKLLYSNGYNIYQSGGTMPGATIYDMENYNGYWYLAGSIYTGNIRVQYGSSWNSVGSGFNGVIYDLETINNELYAGGNTTYNGTNSVPANYVNKYNGSTWSKVGSNNLPSSCTEIEYYNGTIYACGYNYIYYLDATTNKWENKISSSISLGDIRDIEFINGKLYAIEYLSGYYKVISFN